MSSQTKIEVPNGLLLRLHRIHRQRSDVRSQLERGPRQVQAGQAVVASAVEERDRARERLKAATLACDEKQLQLRSREMHVESLEAKLNTAASNREFSLLKEQIAADKQANEVLSDEILEAMERIENLQEEVKQAEAEVEKQTQVHETRVREIEERTKQLQEDLQHVENELQAAEKNLPAEIRREYERLTKAKGEDTFAAVQEDSCEGCGQTLTTNVIDRLRMSVLVNCPACGAMLYLPEDTRPTAQG